MRKHTILLVSFLFPVYVFCQVSRVTLEVKEIPKPIVRDTSIDNWNKKFPEFKMLSSEEKEMLYWTNYSRKEPKRFWDSVVYPILLTFPQLNREEAKSLKADLSNKASLPLYNINSTLNRTSKLHAKDIASNNLGLSHSSSAGKDFNARMNEACIKYCAAENIAVANDNILLALTLLYLDMGLKDAGHRKTLLDPTFSEIGIGSFSIISQQVFLVQDFACKQN